MAHADRLPTLAVLRCFEASAKQESFTAAAEELGLTQSAVSRQVKELEEQIGTPLFRREGRGVRLTGAGRALADAVCGDLERLRRTMYHAIAAGTGPQVLAIAAPPTFAARWLVPRLPKFRDLHDGLEMVVYSRSEPFDLYKEQIDVAVHFGGWDWPGAQLSPLCPETLVAVAAPDLISRCGVSKPLDVLDMPLLHLSARTHLWEEFAKSLGENGLALRQGSHFDQFSLVISAALAGMGAAILPTYLIERELNDGDLIRLADVTTDAAKSYFVATPMGQNLPLAASFTAWLRKQVIQPRMG
ncbi:LysR substrate-binding domain-containing protein [Ahrensia sp. 13_GOM-1096m]|uniref:LysR substrate-binding domain-containing protein n=1 Tax=Ahrensia sp. 13_GOM-1096m TaxID=1380380 RepID=UPI00047CC04C|nr:LysR substrate-binding domain-containing protein [Ahrensia sp. 13_GOM-1096m]